MAKHANTLYHGDNLYIMNGMNSNSVDLIYLDPPFNSKRTYSAPIGKKSAGGAKFKDIWTWDDVDVAYLDKLVVTHPSMAQFIYSVIDIHGKPMAAYLSFMAQRIMEMHRILKSTGSLYLHCDPTASHYLKIICDKIFDNKNFMNEVIWYYNSGPRGKNKFGKRHDVLFRYAKNDKEMFFGEDSSRVPYSPDINIPESKKHYYHPLGKVMDDVWRIKIISQNDKKERTGYPTQKPLALLRRIIKTSSNEGDIVFDPFCGCATTLVAAQQLKRKWIGIDIEAKAVELLQNRLKADSELFDKFVFTDILPTRTDIVIEAPTTDVKQRLYEAQYSKEHDKGVCNGCKEHFNKVNLTIDHIIPKSKGGQDVYNNYQLLCGNCNSVKGNRPMEYLIAKLNSRQEALKYISFTS